MKLHSFVSRKEKKSLRKVLNKRLNRVLLGKNIQSSLVLLLKLENLNFVKEKETAKIAQP